MKNATLSPEAKRASALDRYSVFRIVLRKGGLRFTSEVVDRQRAERTLINQPAGMEDLEGLPKDAFTPDEWESVRSI